MTTTADHVRERIQESTSRVERLGAHLIPHDSERVRALWMEIDTCLKAADLCELLCDDKGMRWQLETVKMLMARM